VFKITGVMSITCCKKHFMKHLYHLGNFLL
jgi:hypothetical protein